MSVETLEEDKFLQGHANRLFNYSAASQTFWLGGTDDEIESLWKWYDSNEPFRGGSRNFESGVQISWKGGGIDLCSLTNVS